MFLLLEFLQKSVLIFFKDVFPDKATERKILSLAIKCPSKDCDWTSELKIKEVNVHLEIALIMALYANFEIKFIINTIE